MESHRTLWLDLEDTIITPVLFYQFGGNVYEKRKELMAAQAAAEPSKGDEDETHDNDEKP